MYIYVCVSIIIYTYTITIYYYCTIYSPYHPQRQNYRGEDVHREVAAQHCRHLGPETAGLGLAGTFHLAVGDGIQEKP